MGHAISSLVFQPPEVSFINSKKHFFLETRLGNRIPAFYLDRKAPVTFLFSHGNAEDLGMIFDWFSDFSRQLHVNVMAYDYSGYGKSTGRPTEENCYADIEAAYQYLTEQLNQSPEQIVLYGRSLGSGPTCYLAERQSRAGKPLAGVILQSPLLSVYRVAFNFRFTFPGDMFPNVDRVRHIESPILIIHGTRDEVVPFWNGEELFLACQVKWRAKPFWVDYAGHNNIETLLREDGSFWRRLTEFLEEWVPAFGHARPSAAASASSS